MRIFSGPITNTVSLHKQDIRFEADASSGAGAAVCSLPDTSGDGADELWIGTNTGVSWLLLGGDLPATLSPQDAAMTFSGTGGLGASMATGDLNGDGNYELALGAPREAAYDGAVLVLAGAHLP